MENNNIEDGIIGCILLDPDSLYKIYDKVKPEMFSSNLCKRIYEKMLYHYDTGKKFDETILANELADERSDKEVFMTQFGNLIMNTPTSGLLDGYTEKLIANYQAKRLSCLIREIEVNPNTVKDTVGTLITRLEEIQTNTKKRSESLKDIVQANKNNYFTETPRADVLHCKIGLDKFDETVAFTKGDLMILAARPSVGKSALATQIAKAVANAGFKVGYFNLEMVKSQIYERLMAGQSGIELERIKNAKCFLGDEKELWDKANAELEKMNIVISSDAITDLDIKAECRHQNFDLIIIDYLQLIEYHERCENKRIETGKISRALKLLAQELNVPILALSQLTRKSEYTQDKEPSMSDLRESGDLEQDASTIILMWNLKDEPEYKEFKGLKVDKNRQGKLMTEALDFLGDKMTFVEAKESLDEVKKMLENKPHSQNSDNNPFIE